MKTRTTSRESLGKPGLMAIIGALGVAHIASLQAAPAQRADDAVWANDQLYATVLTDTAFKAPPPHSTDVIFSFADSGLKGQRAIAEAAPGDPDYNGGRWNVMVVAFTDAGKAIHDVDGDGTVDFELTNAEAVLHHAALGHLTISAPGVYFECPLRPRPQR